MTSRFPAPNHHKERRSRLNPKPRFTVGVQSLTNGIVDTTTSHGKLVFGMFALMAEYEAALIKERTQAGLIAARARGRTGGRKSEMTPALIGKAQRMCANGQNVDSSSSRRMGRNPIRRRHSHIHRALRTHKRVPRVRLHLAIPAASATSPSDRRMEFAEPRRPQDCATASDGSPCRRSGSAQQRTSSSTHPGRGNDLRFSITEVLNHPRGHSSVARSPKKPRKAGDPAGDLPHRRRWWAGGSPRARPRRQSHAHQVDGRRRRRPQGPGIVPF